MRRLSRFVIVGALAGALGFAAPALAQGAGKAQCKHCGKQKAAATAQDADEAILLARQALAAGDLERFDAAAALVGSDHPLRLYIDYWRLRLRIADNRPEHLSAAADADIERFLERHPGLLVTDLLRRDWLLNLGKRQQWTLFDRQYPQWVLRDEPQPACYAGLSRLARGEAVPAETRELLMQPRDLPEACNLLLETMASREQLKPAQLWQRLTLSLEANAPPAIRSAAQLLNPALERRVQQLRCAADRRRR
ncbi:MAG TPA: hypothetical protein VM491_01870, partial [Burkholderiaceae bacterium]|nr:hypothetical protein [Burkholderiaceae bacterium]